MKFLEHELEEKERELKMVKREEEPVHTAIADEDERITALERKVHELDALLKGVTAEMLDLKSVTRKLPGILRIRRCVAATPLPKLRFGKNRVPDRGLFLKRSQSVSVSGKPRHHRRWQLRVPRQNLRWTHRIWN
jgi:hypothetical protein